MSNLIRVNRGFAIEEQKEIDEQEEEIVDIE